MNRVFNLGSLGVAGFYQLHKYKADADGNPIPETKTLVCDWFPNLITNQGLERMGTNSFYFTNCQVGSGNTPPAVTDTALETHVAGTSTTHSTSLATQPSAPYYGYCTGTYRFAAGVAAGNLSEVGVGWGTSGATLFSRALILDGGGNPTTITILSDEILDVTYQFRIYPPDDDVAGSINISGTPYSYVARAAIVTQVSGQFGHGWGTGFGGAMMEIRPSNVTSGFAYTGGLGPITGNPSGSSAQRTAVTAHAYTPGSLTATGDLTWGIGATNIGSYRSVTVAFTGCVFQIEYDPVIPKTPINELKLGFAVSLGPSYHPMIPDNKLSSELIYSPTALPVAKEPSLLESNEFGGVNLNDPSEGLQVKVWNAFVEKGEDSNDSVWVQAPDVSPVWLLSGVDISEISLAFDQNMRPFVAFVESGRAKFYWYDSLLEQPVITTMDEGVITPRATLDDHRQMQLGTSDIALIYIRDMNLYYRRQRDRYQNEILLKADLNTSIPDPRVEHVAMDMRWRLQIKLRGNFYGG